MVGMEGEGGVDSGCILKVEAADMLKDWMWIVKEERVEDEARVLGPAP